MGKMPVLETYIKFAGMKLTHYRFVRANFIRTTRLKMVKNNNKLTFWGWEFQKQKEKKWWFIFLWFTYKRMTWAPSQSFFCDAVECSIELCNCILLKSSTEICYIPIFPVREKYNVRSNFPQNKAIFLWWERWKNKSTELYQNFTSSLKKVSVILLFLQNYVLNSES